VKWRGSVVHDEATLHQVSPYIGKIKSSIAASLIGTFAARAETIYDPFSGSGTVALEAWISGKNVIANDLNPYASLLTRAKLFPCLSTEKALHEINLIAHELHSSIPKIDLREVPNWVRGFFHPATLREVIAWKKALQSRKAYFLLSCLLGVLHHQRPGFLSYPSSHAVPYLRKNKFPRNEYPELYEYRSVRERLTQKAIRTLKRVPELDRTLTRSCYMENANCLMPRIKADMIITSPPYMGQLDYGRDNRLRLWLLGLKDWRALDRTVSPSESEFFCLMKSCLENWKTLLPRKGLCILVLGDTHSKIYNSPLPTAITRIATKELGGYSLAWKHTETIPNNRRVRRGLAGSIRETILVLRNDTDN
jgi:hypothetical protein